MFNDFKPLQCTVKCQNGSCAPSLWMKVRACNELIWLIFFARNHPSQHLVSVVVLGSRAAKHTSMPAHATCRQRLPNRRHQNQPANVQVALCPGTERAVSQQQNRKRKTAKNLPRTRKVLRQIVPQLLLFRYFLAQEVLLSSATTYSQFSLTHAQNLCMLIN